jgi:hypothetical protein
MNSHLPKLQSPISLLCEARGVLQDIKYELNARKILFNLQDRNPVVARFSAKVPDRP